MTAPTTPDDAIWDEYFKRIADTIVIHGVAIQAVGAEGDHPGWSYTIGLNPQHPELIIIGLPPSMAHAILNQIAFRIQNENVVISDGDVRTDLLADEVPARFVAVPDNVMRDREFFNVSKSMFKDVTALQLVYPDKHGNFPWDPDYSLPNGLQPVLNRVP